MKKIFLLAFLLSTCFIVGDTAKAAVYYPDSVVFDSKAEFKGGSSEPVFIRLSDNLAPTQNLSYEIGVSREIKQGKITQFQVLSTNVVTSTVLEKDNWSYNLAIPNPIDNSADATYIIYVRSYAPNNPESEDLVISKSFKIKSTNTPTADLLGGAVVLSNGQEYGFKTGAVIYENPKSDIFATSSKLVLDIRSNTDITLNPKIVFKKLRSSAFEQEITIDPIVIKAGKNTSSINLPTFDYAPGVYLGTITLNPDKQVGLIEKVEFQYIVDGPMVTLGQLAYVSEANAEYLLTIPTFGKPTDYLTPGQTDADLGATTTEIYRTVFTFTDAKGEVLFTRSQNIDYSNAFHNFSILKSKIKTAENVDIKVFAGDKIIFETIQQTNLPKPVRNVVGMLYAMSILLLGIALYVLTRSKKILIFTVIVSLLFAASYVFAVEWSPSPTRAEFMDSNHTVYATFNKNFSTEHVSCDAGGTDVLVKLQVTTCTNSFDKVFVGFSRVSIEDAKNQQGEVLYYGTASTTVPGHSKVFRYNLNYIKIGNLKGPIAANSKMYVRLAIDVYNVRACQTRFNQDGVCRGYAEYVVNLPTTPSTGPGSCDRCTDVEGLQDTPLFTAHGRSYFKSDVDGKLYYADAAATLPSTCAADMCADTTKNEDLIPSDKEWDVNGLTEYAKHVCIPKTTESCSCAGRNKVCIQGGVTTSNAPDASCNLQAFCSYNRAGNDVVFNFTATNVLGTLLGGGPVIVAVPAGSGVLTQSKTLRDTADNQEDTKSCSYTYPDTTSGSCTPGDPGCSGPGSCTPGDPGCAAGGVPTIVSFTASRIVEKGSMCTFTWETAGFDSCSLGGEIASLSGNKSFNTDEGKNITKILSCTLDGGNNTTRTATCLVRPSVVEE